MNCFAKYLLLFHFFRSFLQNFVRLMDSLIYWDFCYERNFISRQFWGWYVPYNIGYYMTTHIPHPCLNHRKNCRWKNLLKREIDIFWQKIRILGPTKTDLERTRKNYRVRYNHLLQFSLYKDGPAWNWKFNLFNIFRLQ